MEQIHQPHLRILFIIKSKYIINHTINNNHHHHSVTIYTYHLDKSLASNTALSSLRIQQRWGMPSTSLAIPLLRKTVPVSYDDLCDEAKYNNRRYHQFTSRRTVDIEKRIRFCLRTDTNYACANTHPGELFAH
jgi:hypothetical protein